MQKSKKSRSKIRDLNLLLFDGFSNLCLANFVEPFRAANTLARDPIYRWQVLSVTGARVQSSSGLSITPDAALAEKVGEVLGVMPSYGFRDFEGAEVTQALRGAAGRHKTIAGLDTGSWLLAKAGLLAGYTATIHWEEHSQFEENFPDVDVVRDRYVVDRDRLTCSGAFAAFDLAQSLIAQHHGSILALEVGELLMSEGQGAVASLPGRPRTSLVNKAWKIMQSNLETPLGIVAVARFVGCSQKTLETRLLEELGITPIALYRRLRLTHARKLVIETGQSVAEIAGRCGYENASAMTRAFRREFGQTPRDLRVSN